MFPPPPIRYPNMRAMVCLFKVSKEIKKKILPPEITPVEFPFDAIFISEYPDSSIGPYNENLILLYCKYEKQPGLFVMNIYVDDDVALAAGREIWGYPKKRAEITLSPLSNSIRGSVARKGKNIIQVEADVLDKAPGLDPKVMIEGSPLYNLKLIPDVEDNTKPALKHLTATQLSWENVKVTKTLKVKSVKSEYSEYDICSEVLNVADTSIGGFYIECDQILPNGKLLKDLLK